VDPGPTILYLFFTLYYTPPFSFLYCLIVYSLQVTRISIFCMYFYPSTYSLCTTPIYILFSHVPSLLHPIRHLLSLSLVSALFLTTPLFLMFLLLPPFFPIFCWTESNRLRASNSVACYRCVSPRISVNCEK